MKRRIILAPVLFLLLAVVVIVPSYAAMHRSQPPPLHSTRTTAAETEQEPLIRNPHSRSGSCGVERWSVKTGTDADVGLINLHSTTQTTIAALAALPAPSTLPANNRIQPTETTVFQLHDTLIEYKLESDSDYHLVLGDGSGNTMIGEIPDPACVGSSSPLLPGIGQARSQFDARYTPTDSFQTANVPVAVTGVGFFDFLHGQTGVAPNGIELHAVLDVQFGTGGTPTPAPSLTPTLTLTATPTPAPTGTPSTINLISNGGFETSGSWTYAGQTLPMRTTTMAHRGRYALQVGSSSGQQGDAVASQMVPLPSSITSAMLSFFYWSATNDSSSYGWQEADLLSSSGQVIQHLFQKTTNDRTWIPVSFDLSRYAGQTIGIQFLDHENSNGSSSYMYVDDVALTVH